MNYTPDRPSESTRWRDQAAICSLILAVLLLASPGRALAQEDEKTSDGDDQVIVVVNGTKVTQLEVDRRVEDRFDLSCGVLDGWLGEISDCDSV